MTVEDVLSLAATGSFHLVRISIVVFVLYYVVTAIHSLYFHPLSKFPGPKFSAISRLPLVRWHFKGKQHEYQCALHAKYGSIVRSAPDEVIVNTAGGWRDIYERKPRLPKDPFSRNPPPFGAETLFTAEGDVHTRLRRTFLTAFSDKSLREQTSIIESHANRLSNKVSVDLRKAPDGALDIAKYYGYTTLDIMGELALGDSFHSLDPSSSPHNLVASFFKITQFGSLRTSLSRFWPLDIIVSWIVLTATSKERMRNAFKGVDMISRRLETGHLESGKSDLVTPFIGQLVEKDEPNKGKRITRAELDVNNVTLLLAGSPLASDVLAAVTFFLLKYPDTMTELQNEIRSKFSSEREITVASTVGMPYLEAVILEALRIHHPTPSDPKPRKVGQEGQFVDGHWIPGGTIMCVPLHATHHSPANFIDCDNFHPERWLPSSDPRYNSRFEKDDKDAFHPFSTGTRSCMGQKLFKAEARTILSKTLWTFDMELIADKDDWTWTDQRAFLAYEPKPLYVRIKEREV